MMNDDPISAVVSSAAGTSGEAYHYDIAELKVLGFLVFLVKVKREEGGC